MKRVDVDGTSEIWQITDMVFVIVCDKHAMHSAYSRRGQELRRAMFWNRLVSAVPEHDVAVIVPQMSAKPMSNIVDGKFHRAFRCS